MSLINGVPFINTLIKSLTSQELNTLKTLIDGGGNQTVLKRTTNTVFSNGPRTRITTSDKGICRCSLEIADSPNVWDGYLIYTDSYCVLIYYTNSSLQALRWLNIDVASQKVEYINEELSVLELRNEIVDIGQSAGTVVVANPTLAGSEEELDGLEVSGTKYKIAKPTTIEANPELDGTETDLTGIQIGNTKYKVGGGSKTYCHNIKIEIKTAVGSTDYYTFTGILKIFNNDSTAFTKSTLSTLLSSIASSSGGRQKDYFLESAQVEGSGAYKNDIIVIKYMKVIYEASSATSHQKEINCIGHLYTFADGSFTRTSVSAYVALSSMEGSSAVTIYDSVIENIFN